MSIRHSFPWIFAVALLAAGCPPQQEVRPDSPSAAKAAPPASAPEKVPGAPAPGAEASGLTLELEPRMVYFGLDSSLLSDEGRAELQEIAERLRRRPGVEVTIAGHTCELGTSEYNLALGQQRARAMRDYLVRLGVHEGRVKTISYGEERPAEEGAGEERWSRNRRGELSFAARRE